MNYSSTATPARKYKLSEAIKKNFQKKSITSLSTCKNVHSILLTRDKKNSAATFQDGGSSTKGRRVFKYRVLNIRSLMRKTRVRS